MLWSFIENSSDEVIQNSIKRYLLKQSVLIELPLRERSNIIWRFRGGGGGCSNRQSAVIWGEGLAKSLYNFYSGKKSLI